jgi:hypothetical protein
MVQAVAQSIPDNVATALTFTVEEFDTDGFHDNAVNNTRITVVARPGYYEFRGCYYSAAPTTLVSMDAFFRKNGVTSIASGDRGNDGAIAQSKSASCIQLMALNDYVEFMALQDSAAAVLTNVSSRFTSYFEWKYLRPL